MFAQFTLVIATEMVEADLLALDAILRPANIPLIICRAYGMIGCVVCFRSRLGGLLFALLCVAVWLCVVVWVCGCVPSPP